MANIRIKNVYAPEVRQPFVPQPTLPNDIADPLFNAQKAMGGAIAGLGGSIAKFGATISAKMEAQAAKAADFKMQNAYIDEATQSQILLNDQFNKAPLGAEGLVQNTQSFFQERYDKILSTIDLPPEQKQELALKFAQLQQSVVAKSLAFADQSAATKATSDLAQTSDNLAKITGADPNELPNALIEWKKAVDALPTNVDAPTRQKLYDNGSQIIGLAAGLSMAQNPATSQAVHDALTPGSKAAGGTPAPAGDTGTQLAFIAHELATTERSAGSKLLGAKTIEQATAAAIGYERPRGWSPGNPKAGQDWSGRLAAAKRIYAGGGNAREDAALNYFMGRGLDRIQASGLVGNLARESGLRTSAVGDSGTAYGIPQWRGERLKAYKAFAKVSGADAPNLADIPATSTGNPVLDKLTWEQQQRVLSAANTALNQQGASDKAQLTIDENNAIAGTGTGGTYNGPMPSRDRYIADYGPVVGEQKFADFQGRMQEGRFRRENATASPEQLQTNLEAAVPKQTLADGSPNPTYATELQTYLHLQNAVDELKQARTQDSAAYAIQYFPDVKKAYLAQSQGTLQEQVAASQQFFAQLSKAYDQLGLPTSVRKAFPAQTVTAYKDHWDSLTPPQLVNELGGLARDTGPLFDAALTQLEGADHTTEAYIARRMQTNPELAPVLVNAIIGRRRAYGKDGVEALRPLPSDVNQALITAFGSEAFGKLPDGERRGIADLATGLYIFNGGAAKATDGGKQYISSVNAILGGAPDNPVIIGNEPKTILPPHVWAETYQTAKNNFDDSFYKGHSVDNLPPLFNNGDAVTAADIEHDGVFVYAGNGAYMVYMKSTGGYLRTDKTNTDGLGFAPYLVNIGTEDFNSYAAPKTDAQLQGLLTTHAPQFTEAEIQKLADEQVKLWRQDLNIPNRPDILSGMRQTYIDELKKVMK